MARARWTARHEASAARETTHGEPRPLLAEATWGAWLGVLFGVAAELAAPLGGQRLRLYELVLVPVEPLDLSSLAQLVAIDACAGAAVGLGVALALRLKAARGPRQRIDRDPRWLTPWLVAAAAVVLAIATRAAVDEVVARALVVALCAAVASNVAARGIARRRLAPALSSGALVTLAAAAAIAPVAWRVIHGALEPPPGTAVARERPDVLLVVLDTTRADHLGSYGYALPTTPRLDRLAAEGALFERAYAAAPWTLPSHASLFTGLDVATHGATWEHRRLDDRFATIATRLHALGYATVAVSENPFIGASTGFARGFDAFFEMYGYGRRTVTTRLAEQVARKLEGRHETDGHTEASLETLTGWLAAHRGRGQPVFAFVNLMAAHLPNYPRAEWPGASYDADDLAELDEMGRLPDRFFIDGKELDARQLALLEHFYDGDLHHLDGAVGRLVEWLRRSGHLDRTLLVVTADHGENFGDHGFLEHQYCIYDSLLHVPLLVRYPARVAPGTRVAQPVSTLDLADTILDVVEPGATARSLLREPRRAALFAETSRVPLFEVRRALDSEFVAAAYTRFPEHLESVRLDGYKLIRGSDGSRQLFQIEVDPGETRDLARERPEVVEGLSGLLDAHASRRAPEPVAVSARIPVDPVAHEVMQSLGYVR